MLKQPSLKQALNALFTKSTAKEPSAESSADSSSADSHTDSEQVVSEPTAGASSTAVLAAPAKIEVSFSKPVVPGIEPSEAPSKDLSEAKPATDADAAESKSAKKRWGFSKRKVAILRWRGIAIALTLLGAGGGLAFTQAAPALQEALEPDPAKVPLNRANDPIAEPVLETQDLFLTNEIFYRKIEAIAQVPRQQTAPSTPIKKGTTASAAAPSKTDATQPKPDAAATKAEAVKQAEAVKADAPPVPAAAPAPFLGTTIDSVLEMRVAVAKDVSAIAFATSNGGTLTDLDGNVLKDLPAETSAYAEISSGLVVDGAPMPTAFWVYPEDGGYVAIGSSWYRGRVLIALRERGLIAVNHVLLGDYLYSVVGSEMSPGWAIESLKAQAVAARSYALTHNIHPASEDYFDLDNTQRFQAYKGIDREANTTQAAVQATAGEFISHEGGIVESLYAASQAIVDDAHKGSGMSQLGARDLADQGYGYTEILSHYYPGTALGRLETDSE